MPGGCGSTHIKQCCSPTKREMDDLWMKLFHKWKKVKIDVWHKGVFVASVGSIESVQWSFPLFDTRESSPGPISCDIVQISRP